MRAQMRVTIALGIFVFCCAVEARAFPIPPVSLLELCRCADAIAVGKVVKPVEFMDSESDGVAEVRVTRVYKGDAKVGDLVRVTGIEPGMICPAPPCYPANATGIAFLRKNVETDGYTTVGLSYGSKFVRNEKDPLANHPWSLTLEDLRDIEAATAEYIKIEQLADPEEKKRATIDWLVGLTEHPATARSGCQELCDSAWSYTVKQFAASKFAGDLTDAHKARLAANVMRWNDVESVLPFGLLLQDYESELVTRKLVSALERGGSKSDVVLLMKLIAKRERRPFVGDVIKRSERVVDYDFLKSKEGAGLLREFAQLYADLPELKPAEGADPRAKSNASKPTSRPAAPGFQKRYPRRRGAAR